MQDIKQYSDKELSLLIYNDEYLYKQRHEFYKSPSALGIFFEYRPEQLETFLSDYESEEA